jgi:hypothetical protein
MQAKERTKVLKPRARPSDALRLANLQSWPKSTVATAIIADACEGRGGLVTLSWRAKGENSSLRVPAMHALDSLRTVAASTSASRITLEDGDGELVVQVVERDSHDGEVMMLRELIGTFPAEFGLRAYPGDRFRISESASFFRRFGDPSSIQLYTQRWCDEDGSWKDFCKGSEQELRRQVKPLKR